MNKIFQSTLLILTTTLFLLMIIPALMIASYSSQHDGKNLPCAIVLGAAVWNNHPSPVYRERIHFAIDLYKRNKIKAVYFTGGIGKDDTISEGEVGKNYAVSKGVNPRDIKFEGSSKTTLQNLKFIYPKLTNNDLKKPACYIISDPLHLRRAIYMAKDLGIDAKPAATPTSMYKSFSAKANFLLNEIYFLYAYWLFEI